jgi:hypothetical protein
MDIQQAGAKRQATETAILDANKEKLHADMAALKVSDKTLPPPLPVAVVEASRFTQAEFRRAQYVLNLPADFPYDDLFTPESWKNIARMGKLNMGDTIEVRKDDMSLWALLIVREAIPNHARIVVTEIFKKDLAAIVQEASDDEQFEIKHLGLQDQWAVLLRSTGRVLMKDMKSRDAAKNYIHSLRPQSIGG